MAIAVNSKTHSIFGDKAAVIADLAFSGTYPYGGVSLDNDRLFGIHDVELALVESRAGYSFQHDAANKKIKIFGPAPPIVYDEKQVSTAGVVTTKYPAAFIMNVARSGANIKLRSTGIAFASLGADECSLVAKMAAGARTQITVKGYDRLLSTGLFTGALTGWTDSGAGADWTALHDKADKDATGTTTLTEDTFVPVVGETYRVSYTITDWTSVSGTVTLSCGGVTLTAREGNGVFAEDFTAIATTGLVITPSDASIFTIDTVTVHSLSEPVYITYVTQAWKDVWDNLVQDESVTFGSDNSSSRIFVELMPNQVDRDFSGASAWADVDFASGGGSYGETTDLSLLAGAGGAADYCTLAVASAPTVIGKSYTLAFTVDTLTGTFTVKSFDGTQTIGTVSAAGAQEFTFTATTLGGLRLVAVSNNATANFDNFSLSPAGGDKILAVMYADLITTPAALTMIDSDDIAANGEVRIKFNSATAQLTYEATQAAEVVKVTYVKVPTSGFLSERAFSNESSTKRLTSSGYVNIFQKPVLLWGYAGQMPVNTGTTQRMIDYAATPGAGEFVPYWNKGSRPIPPVPALVVEEVVTCASNVGTLAYVPLYIVAIQVTATTTTGYYHPIPAGKTPATKEVAVNFTTGGLTFLSTDAVTSVKVTYIPKRDTGFLSQVTVDEAVTSSVSKVNLAARAGLVQYVYDVTDGKRMPFDLAQAEHYCTVDIIDSTNTSIDSNAADAANTLWVTYVPFTNIPAGCLIDSAAITLDDSGTTEMWNFTGNPGVNGYNHTVVPAFGPQLFGTCAAGTNIANATLGGPTGTAGNGVATWNPATNSIVTLSTDPVLTVDIPWMILDVNQLTPALPVAQGQIIDLASNVTGTGAGVWGNVGEIATVPLEIPEISLTDLTSVKGVFIGH